MANTLKEQKLIDSNKRSLLKYVFISDGTQESGSKIVDAANLAFALDTTGKIKVGTTNTKSKYTTTVKRIFGNYSGAGYMKLDWDGTGNTEIAAFGPGTIDIDFENRSEPSVISNLATGSNGNILLTTVGASSATVATLVIELRKDSADYDAGQTADPAAFNKGSYGR